MKKKTSDLRFKLLIFYVLVRRTARRIKRKILFRKSFSLKMGTFEFNYIEKRKRRVIPRSAIL